MVLVTLAAKVVIAQKRRAAVKQPTFPSYRTASLAVHLFKLLARNYWLNSLFNDPRKVVKPGIYATQVNVGCGGSLMP